VTDGSHLLACVEVGGSSTQTVLFDGDGTPRFLDGAHQPNGARLALAVPGLLDGHRVISASNLGWSDVDPVAALGLAGPAAAVRNDAEAAALGEAALRGFGADDVLAFVGLGTGIGGAVVAGGDRVAESNLFGHEGSFGDAACRCGRRGCLETVAGGWSLPPALDGEDLRTIAHAVGRAVASEPAAVGARVVVVGGGMAQRHPHLVELIAAALPNRRVEPSAAPAAAKSAAAWGLRRLAARAPDTVAEGRAP